MSDELDAELRAKLRALAAAAEDPPLSAEHERGLVAALSDRQRQRRQLRRGLALAAGCAAAAACLLLLWRGTTSPLPQQTPARCGLPRAVIAQDAAGKQRLGLGALGELVANPEAELQLLPSDACTLRLQLGRGTLAGDLRNLRPAQLHVETALGRVVVRGTRFSVTADEALEVVLLSGKVDVEAETHAALTLQPAQVLRRTRQRDRIEASAEPDAERIRALLSRASPQAAAAAPTPHSDPAPAAEEIKITSATGSPELLERAEVERKRGDLVRARQLYEAAVRRGDVNGEVALLRWIRLELGARDFQRAASLLATHPRRFPRGKLGAEAAWLEIEVLRARGDLPQARERASTLGVKFPGTPQADAARAWLSAP